MSAAKPTAAIFSNLAKAAEKQQRAEASGHFATLAAYYDTAGGNDSSDTVSDQEQLLASLRSSINNDLESGYVQVNESASEVTDRGALRAAKWGDKATRIQRGLLDRYLKKGDALLEGQDLFVCEACGFIALGNTAPDICPVCKAPSSRFVPIR